MSKELTSETTVIEASLDSCVQIRKELIDKFDYIWLIVYQKNPKTTQAVMTVSNAIGGRLDRKTADEVIAHAKKIYDKAKS